uniref:Uncharacterized protein n=1 Tax=uncultured Alphaproteobacteria bacterium TaxID=91750 RepID=A0A5Q5AQD9_9PROT|nr:hypothetical protein [uncultured Alphaproteobacteria bacterium]
MAKLQDGKTCPNLTLQELVVTGSVSKVVEIAFTRLRAGLVLRRSGRLIKGCVGDGLSKRLSILRMHQRVE